MRSSVGKALKRAALDALGASVLISCSGSPDAASGSGSSAGSTSGGAPCAVRSSDAGAGALPLCIRSFELAGPASACDPDDAGELTTAQCDALCAPGTPVSCAVYAKATASYVSCYYGACNTGRRPEGLARDTFEGRSATGRFLAEAAFLEAASIDAFERLTRELRAHGAPRRLCAASERAARDEARHARMTRRLAKRAGASVPRCRIGPGGVRPIEGIAIENAVEGCVRETFGAAIAIIQAERASDGQVRKAMKSIARDEMRHAQLSWAVAEWLEPKLDAQARARVHHARAKAVDALARSVSVEPNPTLTKALGIPTAAVAFVVLRALQRSLWSLSAASRTPTRATASKGVDYLDDAGAKRRSLACRESAT